MEILCNVFDPLETLGYETVMRNRKRGVTCRTWVIKVYEKLRVAGHVERTESASQIEEMIKRRSMELERMLAEGKFDTAKVFEI